MFFPAAAPGETLIHQPKHLIYSRLSFDTIITVEVRLYDEDGKLINLRTDELTISFHVHESGWW
jgi:hypothetical protein